MISLRLLKIASLIDDNSKIINVGTGHALLEIYLAQNKNVSSIGIDISESSIKKSKKNVSDNNLNNMITIIKNDGLNNIKLKDEVITISGLGTHTILKILKNVKYNDLIIQSNNDLYTLRKEMIKKNYYIYKEEVIYDKRWYVIIYFKYGKKKYSNLDLYLGPFINNKDYINYLIRVNEKKFDSIPNKNFIKKYQTKKIIKQLKNCR